MNRVGKGGAQKCTDLCAGQFKVYGEVSYYVNVTKDRCLKNKGLRF